MTKLQNKTSKGFSLLELLLVVAVGAILILAGLAIYRNITNTAQNNEAVRLLTVIKQEVIRAYQGQQSYGNASLEALLLNSDAIPADSRRGNDILTPFAQGAAAVTVVGADDFFDVTFTAIPRSACIRLFTSFTQDDKELVSFAAGAGASPSNIPLGNVTPVQANTTCAADNMTMRWRFR